MKRLFQRAYHLWQRVVRELKALPMRWRVFGAKVAWVSFWDGLIPPGKSPRYIATIENAVDTFLSDLNSKYNEYPSQIQPTKPEGKIPVWCCWWQGEETMPEVVRLCYTRLKQVIPEDKAELHLITKENYLEYTNIPWHVVDRFDRGYITMTTMSDVLRFRLLELYGGYWLDLTVFFTGDIPEQYFSGEFYCQRMATDKEKVAREACKGNWCGFSMAGPKDSVVFRYMNDAFSTWWASYKTIIDYVLIDYILLSGFKHIPELRAVIDAVPDNNEDIFAMYKELNEPYTEERYARLTQRNVMHKFTTKMDFYKTTPNGEQTLYGYLCDQVFGKD